ncbi:hypothetical protein [Labilibacter marinus]|uniref:hypothetical protein n=1 Tax=Labilibacter marinus TaxID=1477105 RepID=UPI0008378FBF|nr:hypothetical protein [Labilibacter marinus]
MESFSFQRPWISAVRGISYIALGLFAIIQKPDSFQPLLLIMALLIGFIVVLSLGETTIMKKTKLKGTLLGVFIIHVFILVVLIRAFFFYESGAFTIERARFAGIVAVMVSVGFNVVLNLMESFALIRAKIKFWPIYIIEAILSLMLMTFIFSLVKGINPVFLEMIGYYSIGFGVISILLTKIVLQVNAIQSSESDND